MDVKNVPKFLLVVAASIIVIAIAVYLGIVQRNSDDSQSTDSATLLESDASNIAKDSSELPIRQDPNTPATKSRVRTLSDIEQIPALFSQTAALYQLLESADEPTVLQLFEESKSLQPLAQRHIAQNAIILRYATIDPINALSHINGLTVDGQNRLIGTIFSMWARTDLEAAIQHAVSMSHEQRYIVLRAILLAKDKMTHDDRIEMAQKLGLTGEHVLTVLVGEDLVVIKDPRVAWYELLENTDELTRTGRGLNSLVRIANLWVKEDGIDVVREIADSLERGDLKDHVLNRVIAGLAASQPKEAFSLALELPGNPRFASSVIAVALTWAQSEPSNALQATQTVDSELFRMQLQTRILRDWASRDPYEVLNQIDSFPDSLRETARARVAASLADTSPQEALELLSDIGNLGTRRSASLEVARNWSRKDPKAAIAWVMSTAEHRNERSLVSAVMSNYAMVNPKSAVALALQIEAEHDINTVVPQTIETIARMDVEVAEALLNGIPKARRLDATRSFIQEIVSWDPDKVFRLAQLENAVQQERLLNFEVMDSWARSNPRQLLGKLNQFRSSDVTYRAATRLLAIHRIGPYFTLSDEEVESLEVIVSEIDPPELEQMILIHQETKNE